MARVEKRQLGANIRHIGTFSLFSSLHKNRRVLTCTQTLHKADFQREHLAGKPFSTRGLPRKSRVTQPGVRTRSRDENPGKVQLNKSTSPRPHTARHASSRRPEIPHQFGLHIPPESSLPSKPWDDPSSPGPNSGSLSFSMLGVA